MNTNESLSFLIITGYKDRECVHEVKMFTAQINPETFNRSISFSGDEQKTKNKKGQKAKSVKMTGETYNFDIILDGTGVIDNVGKGDITAKIDELLSTLYEIKEEAQTPHHLKLVYCNLSFRCVVSSVSIKYTLFSRDGKPLRAQISCSFNIEGLPTVANKNDSISTGATQPSTSETTEKNGDVDKILENAFNQKYNTIHPQK